jgi:DHA2 family multidrug resistance protein
MPVPSIERWEAAGQHPMGGSVRLRSTLALMTATAMQAFDATIANVALPQLERSLSGGIELGVWVMTSYLCASAVVAPLTGWLRQRFGADRLFPPVVMLYAVASLRRWAS